MVSILSLTLFYLLLSNAITLRRDKSILYSRVAIVILILTALIIYSNLYITFLSKGIGIFGGLFYTKYNNSIIQLFIILLSMIILNLTAFYPRKVWTEKYSSIYRLVFCKLIYYQTSIFNKMNELYIIIVHTDIPKPYSDIEYILKCPASWFTFNSKDEKFSDDDKSENKNSEEGSLDKEYVEPKEVNTLSERRNQGSLVVKIPDIKKDPAECKHKKFFRHVAEERDPAMLCDVCGNDNVTKDIGFCYTCCNCQNVYCRSCMFEWDNVEDEPEEVPLEKVPDFVPEPTGTPPNSWVSGEEYLYSYQKEPKDYIEAGEGYIGKTVLEARAKMANDNTSSSDGYNSPDAPYNAGNLGLGLARKFSNGKYNPCNHVFFKCSSGPNNPDIPNSLDAPNSNPDGFNRPDASNPDVPNSSDTPNSNPGDFNSSDTPNSNPDGFNSTEKAVPINPDAPNGSDAPNSPDAPNNQESPLDYVIGIENQEPLDILDPD